MTDPSRRGLADFLRSRRERLSPEAVGLATGRRRRTLGLRREEVAALAGIGADWYTRLEQGRTANPSPQTVSALARALSLSPLEHAHLKALAQNCEREAFVREEASPALRRLVESLPQPAYVTGRRFDVIAWNAAAAELFTDFTRLAPDERNILTYLLLDPSARVLFGAGWETEARRITALFRAAYDLWSGDPDFEALLWRLLRDSPPFKSFWETHDLQAVSGGRKRFEHPDLGVLLFDHASFQANDDPALKLIIYTRVRPH